MAAWTNYIIVAVLVYYILLAHPREYVFAQFALFIIHRLCEGAIALSLCALVDRKGGPIRLLRYTYCGYEYDEGEKISAPTTTLDLPSGISTMLSTTTPASMYSGEHTEELENVMTDDDK